MLPEEEIIYNILNPTLNSYIENPVENFSDNLVVVKNKLTAIVQENLANHVLLFYLYIKSLIMKIYVLVLKDL